MSGQGVGEMNLPPTTFLRLSPYPKFARSFFGTEWNPHLLTTTTPPKNSKMPCRGGGELPTFLQRPPHLNYKKSCMGGVSPPPLYNNHPTQNIKDDAGMGVNLHLFMITTQIKKINHLSTMNIPKPKKCVGGGGEPSPDYDDQIIEIAISITRPVNKLNCRHCSRCWPLPSQKQNLTHRICTAWCSAR